MADGLNYIAPWNAAMLISNDLGEAMLANAGKRAAEFKDQKRRVQCVEVGDAVEQRQHAGSSPHTGRHPFGTRGGQHLGTRHQ